MPNARRQRPRELSLVVIWSSKRRMRSSWYVSLVRGYQVLTSVADSPALLDVQDKFQVACIVKVHAQCVLLFLLEAYEIDV